MKTQNQPQAMIVPQIKTFKFRRGTSQHEIDSVINAWLLNRAEEGGTPPQFGKVGIGMFRIIYVFYFAEQIKKKEVKTGG